MLLYRPVKRVKRIMRTGRITPMDAQYLARKAHRVAVNHHRHAARRARAPRTRADNGATITNPDLMFFHNGMDEIET